MHGYRRILCWMLTVVVLLACLPCSVLADAQVQSAPLTTASTVRSGMVRVLLSSMQYPSALDITVYGDYTAEGDARVTLFNGAQVSIRMNTATGQITLITGGISYDMGRQVKLRRHQTTGQSGLKIAQAKRPGNLYPGDLQLTAQSSGSAYRLYPIMHVYIEYYLHGVVPYEMGNGAHLEALKAQAVAARTYAMQRKWSAGNKDYDLVDTTGDQVFKGYNAEYTHVIEAVRATEGVVGVYNGGFATCYYTASNGGEIALPSDVWSGGGDYGYLARREDPYDLENPNSMVSSVTFAPGAADNAALHAMLEEGLLAAAQAQGLEAEGLEFEEIRSIEAINPVAEGSIMFQTLRFTLSASALEPAWLPKDDDAGSPGEPHESRSANLALYTIDYLRRLLLDSPYEQSKQRRLLDTEFTVDLDVYRQIKDGLKLGLNSSDCEIVSVKKGVFDFTIEMRRFGHGVGMSQRGAQRMAGVHEKTWLEILDFYYPNMSLEKIEWATPALQPIDALPESIGAARPDPTPTPTPAPLPALQDGEYYAAVALEDAGSTLNMRQSPTTQSPVVCLLYGGRRLIVCGEADADGWVAVKTAEESGYVKLEYLEKE